jgi:protein-S-isoprenylcysteine O-methyltransferase Ste14
VVSDQQTSRPQQIARPDGASTAELVSLAASQISTLVRDELALGRAELMEKGKRAGLGGGLFGAAGVLGIYGFGLFLALFVVLLDLVWPLWLAVLVVLVVVLAVAALAAFIGKRTINSATPAVPTETADRIKTDVQVVKDAFRDGRRS